MKCIEKVKKGTEVFKRLFKANATFPGHPNALKGHAE